MYVIRKRSVDYESLGVEDPFDQLERAGVIGKRLELVEDKDWLDKAFGVLLDSRVFAYIFDGKRMVLLLPLFPLFALIGLILMPFRAIVGWIRRLR